MSELSDNTQRQKHPKVRSGCITWIRRVKCDEGRPNCWKCTSTGRKCDGYQPQGLNALRFRTTTIAAENGILTTSVNESFLSSPRINLPASHPVAELQLPPSPYNPLLNFQGSPREHRAYDFFRRQAAPDLSGYFDSPFWSELVPRIGASEPAIKHAILALGAMYEAVSDSEPYPDMKQQTFALQQYNKAIISLQKSAGSGSKSIGITLLTCILFVCLEFMRGNPEFALNHMQSGIKILSESRKVHRISSFVSRRKDLVEEPAAKSLEQDLVHTFARLSVQASLYGRHVPQQSLESGIATIEDRQSASKPFSSISEARMSLDQIFFQSLEPQNISPSQCIDSKLDPRFSPDDVARAERDNLNEQLSYWNSRVGLFLVDSVPALSREDMARLRVLRILSIIGRVWNATTLTDVESSFDNHLEDFSTIVRLAESFINENSDSQEASPSSSVASTPTVRPSTPSVRSNPRCQPFTFEMGIIPTLYMTAIKCRSPSLRRKAIGLLLVVIPRREGLWDARMLARMAQRIVELEEGPDTTETNWPPEKRRIHGSYWRVGFDSGERTTVVEFASRPGGPESDWRFWVEDVSCWV